MFDRMRYTLKRILALVLSSCRLHCFTEYEDDSVQWIEKRRFRWGPIACMFGNVYLWSQRCSIRALQSREWIRWEHAVSSALKRDFLADLWKNTGTHQNVLTMRRLKGRTLQQVLIDPKLVLETKLLAVGWASRALICLHSHKADWGSGTFQSISHGDATVSNVIVDLEKQSAQWIDLDMRHLPNLSELDRQTDDFRAFLFSAAACVEQSHREQVLRVVTKFMSEYGDKFVARYRKRLQGEWGRPNTFQLAQAPFGWIEYQEWIEVCRTFAPK